MAVARPPSEAATAAKGLAAEGLAIFMRVFRPSSFPGP